MESPIHDRILDAAKKCFLAQGFNGSNLRDIAKGAQVSMGGIYHHFGSKEEIYQALLNSNEVPQALSNVVSLFRDPTFPENLGEIGSKIFGLVKEHRDFFKLIYIDVLEFQSKNVNHVIQSFRKMVSHQSAALLKKRTDAGDLADIHPAIIVRCMFDIFMHLGLEEVMTGSSLAEELGLTQNQMASQMAKVLLYGAMRREN
jgi:AcrR family transcriptional regulator